MSDASWQIQLIYILFYYKYFFLGQLKWTACWTPAASLSQAVASCWVERETCPTLFSCSMQMFWIICTIFSLDCQLLTKNKSCAFKSFTYNWMYFWVLQFLEHDDMMTVVTWWRWWYDDDDDMLMMTWWSWWHEDDDDDQECVWVSHVCKRKWVGLYWHQSSLRTYQ